MTKEVYCNICGVILAGGKNSRLRQENKALLKLNGITFYENAVALLQTVFGQVLVVTNTPGDFPNDGVPKYPDIKMNIGPLGGIYTALANAKKSDSIFVVAVDMPFISEDLIRRIINGYKKEKAEIYIPRIGEYIEPLHAVYSTAILPGLTEFIKTTEILSIRSFFKHAKVRYLDLEPTKENEKIFVNINSAEDYIKYFGKGKLE